MGIRVGLLALGQANHAPERVALKKAPQLRVVAQAVTAVDRGAAEALWFGGACPPRWEGACSPCQER
jgi:hypothetical protein